MYVLYQLRSSYSSADIVLAVCNTISQDNVIILDGTG